MSCTEGALTLERLDYRRVGDQTTVVRLLARLSADLGAPHGAELLVTTGSDRRRFPARPRSSECRPLDRDPVRGHATGSELLWRATFGLPVALVESPDARFALVALTSVGALAVTLPAPDLVGAHPRRLALAEPRLRVKTSWLVAGQTRIRMALLATTVVVTTTATPAVAFADGGSSGPAAATSAAATSSPPPALVVPATATAPGAGVSAPASTAAPSSTAATPAAAPTPAAPAPAAAPAARPRALHAAVRIGVGTGTGHTASPAHLAHPKVTHFFTAASHSAAHPHVHHHATVHPTCGRGAATGWLVFAAGGHRGTAPAAPGAPASCTTSTGPGHRHAPPGHQHAPTAASPAPHQGGSLTTGSQPGPARTSPTGTRGDHRARRRHAAAHHHHSPARHHPTPAPVTTAPSSGSSTSTPPHAGVYPLSWTGSVLPNPSLTGPVADLSGLATDPNRPPSFLIPIYMEAGRRYKVPWTVLAAINSIESDYGRNLSTSSAGALGWMQFEPSTWREYGLAVDGESVPNPYDPRDAIFSAARYLAAAGAATNITTAIFAYNHAGWYVDEVMSRARAIAGTAQYARRTLTHGVFSISFATGIKHHATVSYRGGVLSHYDRLIAAANMVSAAGFPYLWGGGHTQPARFGPFDCSGTVSYVMQQAGYTLPTVVANDIPSWHFPAGPGQVTIFYNPTHTFMRIGDRFFGTSDSRPGGGAGWVPVSRLPADYLAGFGEVHVPRLGLNSFSPQPRGLLRLVGTRRGKIAASFSLGVLVFGAWKGGLTPF